MNIQIINDQLKAAGFPHSLESFQLEDGFYKFPQKYWMRIWRQPLDGGRINFRFTFNSWKSQDKNQTVNVRFTQSGELDLGKTTRLDTKAMKLADREAKEQLSAKQLKAKDTCEQLYSMYLLNLSARNSSYLGNKGFGGFPPFPAITVDNREDVQTLLVVPGFDGDGNLWTLQTVYTKTKTYQKNSRTKDIIHIIGCEPKDYRKICPDIPKVLIAEGYATALACFLSCDLPTFCCFSVGNLEYGVQQAKKKYPNAELVICADNDGGTLAKEGHNPGLQTAFELALKYEVKCAWPWSEGKNVDYCDLWPDSTEISHHANNPKSYADARNYHHALISLHLKHSLTKKSAVSQTKKRTAPKVSESLESLDPQPAGILLDVPHLNLPTDSKDEPVTKDINTLEQLLESKKPIDSVEKFDYDSVKPTILKDRGEKGGVQGTINNFRILCDYIGATLRYNMISKDQDWIIPGERNSIDEAKESIFARFEDLCTRANFPIARLRGYLTYLSNQHQYNPVDIWIKSAPWDGTSRLEEFFSTVTVKNESDALTLKMKKVLILKWLAMAIKGAISERGVSMPGMLVFQGVQSVGKTSWFNALVPSELDLLADGKSLNPHDRDSVKQVVKYWLVELGELDATFKKAEIAALKGFLTRNHDEFRPAYAKTESKFARRTAFFGSVNDVNFLVDTTGNRRFWVLEVAELNFKHKINMQQLWAEVYYLVESKGQTWWLTKDEENWLNESNRKFESIDPLEEEMIRLYDWKVEGEPMTASEIAKSLGLSNPGRHDTNSVARIARKLSGVEKIPTRHGRRILWTGKRREHPGVIPF